MIKKIFLNNIKNNKFKYVLLLLLVVALVIIGLIPARALEHIINDYLLTNDKVTNILISLACLYCFSLVFSGLLDFIKQILLINLGESFTKDIRLEMARKLKRIDPQYLSNNDSGVISSRFINDVDAINTIFTDGIISMGIDALKVIGIVVSMFVYDYRLGIFTVCIIPIIYIISRTFKKLMLRAQLRNRSYVGNVNNHISETISNIKMIKIFSKEKYMEDTYDNYLENSYHSMMKVTFYDSFYSPLIQLTCAIIIVALVVLFNGNLLPLALSAGVVAGSIEYISSLFEPIESLGMELQTIQKAKSGLVRVNEFLSSKDEEEKNVHLLDELHLDEGLTMSFDNVCFAYEDDVLVIKNLSLTINKLEKISFIGRTGVGKTTLFKLIMGNLVPVEGSIKINDVDVSKVENGLKYRLFGYVDQQFNAIKGNIKENLTMKNISLSDEDVLKALSIVGLEEKIVSFEKGLYTEYVDSNFSQGEKQLLNIARAIVSNPPILLLDEMTASLDTITEKKVIEALERASKDRTILSISHRLSSCLSSDRVVEIEKGSVKRIYTQKEFLGSELYTSLVKNSKK